MYDVIVLLSAANHPPLIIVPLATNSGYDVSMSLPAANDPHVITIKFYFRAINNGLLDTYQLKSLDGLLEAAVEDMVLEQRDGRIFVQFPWDADSLKLVQAKKGKGDKERFQE